LKSDASLIRVTDLGGFLLFLEAQMLKVNVGLSRKVSRDFNSTGFSLNLEGELCVGPDDPEMMIEKIKEFYDLAEEALNQQIERYDGESAIASRDETTSPPPANHNAANLPRGNGQPQTKESPNPRAHSNGNGKTHQESAKGERVPATNKQIQFLLTLGKRQGMTKPQLENRIAGLIGRASDLYELSKQEAGMALDSLTDGAKNGNGRRQ
jgi:hypothetical protein